MGEARRAIAADGRRLVNKTGDVRRLLVDKTVGIVRPDVEYRVANAIGYLKDTLGRGEILGSSKSKSLKGEKQR